MKCGFCQIEISKNISLNDILFSSKIIFNECCDSCYDEVVQAIVSKTNCCHYCKKKLDSGIKICSDCKNWMQKISHFDLKHDYLYEYNEKMKEYFESYKFLGDIRLGRIFSRDVNHRLLPYINKDYLIIPIPLSIERLEQRGFNQVEVILENAQVEFSSVLLKKCDVEPQSSKNKEQRLQSIQPFYLKKGAERDIHKRKVLLIDDVYTTGRTILHAYECIIQAKPIEIRSFSLTR